MIGRLQEAFDVFGKTDAAEAAVNGTRSACAGEVAAYPAGSGDRRIRDEIAASTADVDQRIADLNARHPAPDDFGAQREAAEEARLACSDEFEARDSGPGYVEARLEGADQDYADVLATEDGGARRSHERVLRTVRRGARRASKQAK
jgi:hypothetical protein